MIPEIGQFALIIALCLAVALSYFGLIGAYNKNNDLMSLVNPLTYAQFIFVIFAFFCLAYSFIIDDFSDIMHSRLFLILSITGCIKYLYSFLSSQNCLS